MQHQKKTVLITGCTPGGIGFAVATEFLNRGLHVIATVRDAKLLDEITHHGMSAIHLDVDNGESIAACQKEVENLTGGYLDILVNNAGRGLVTPAIDTDITDARAVFETNIFGPMAMTKTFIDMLIRTQGLIINISSLSALVPYVFGSTYSASKAALAAYSRTLRQELRPFGVRVQVVMAGTVKSNVGRSVRGYLPPDSLYQRVRHLYIARRAFSQKASSTPMETDEFARKLVGNALREETRPFWRAWGWGRPDWLYHGGMARKLYWGSCWGEWILDLGAWRRFGLRELEEMIQKDRETGKLEGKTG